LVLEESEKGAINTSKVSRSHVVEKVNKFVQEIMRLTLVDYFMLITYEK
jgi:hypothetical protein